MSKPSEMSVKNFGAKKCANKKSSKTNNDASRRRNSARSVNWSDKKRRRRGPGGKRSMTKDALSVSACVKNKGHWTSNEIESERSDTNEEGEKTEIGIATGIGIETVTAMAPQRIGLIVVCPLVVGIQNERSPPRPKTQLLRQYPLSWTKSPWKKLRYKCC